MRTNKITTNNNPYFNQDTALAGKSEGRYIHIVRHDDD